MTDKKTILILGAGIDGIALATRLRRLLPRAHRIALVDREEAHVFAPSLLWRGAPRRFGGEGSCFIETGDGRAGFGSGNFYAEPAPQIRLRQPSAMLHWGKIAYEKYWLWRAL